MKKTIIIIGAGMGGLAAGIYGCMNGFSTTIVEAHTIAGGQCTAWKRKGYTFDACIHHLFGCSSQFELYHLWQEIGVMPREMIKTEEYTSVLAPDGTLFRDYFRRVVGIIGWSLVFECPFGKKGGSAHLQGAKQTFYFTIRP